MRLIDTNTLQLHHFDFDSARPKYAALSHRWTDDEISFKDFQKGRSKDSAGYRKISDACTLASSRGLWLWADTVCIDKRSSAELTEAINSMYQWYERAAECYAYLYDVSDHPSPQHGESGSLRIQEFCQSVWFTRAWTLQELLAPQRVIFYSRGWQIIGVKGPAPDQDDEEDIIHLEEEISRITGIPEHVLAGETHLSKKSVAQKMSWLAPRTCTRLEDIAYCVLGIFEVNMPLLYGEGPRAWIRLQEEIIRRSHDESIFTWSPVVPTSRSVPILAVDPSCFRGCGDVEDCSAVRRPAYAMTNQGLELRLKAGTAMQYSNFSSAFWYATKRVIVVELNCAQKTSATGQGLQLWVLFLVERSCGHFERLECKPYELSRLITVLGSERRLLEADETIYVHTTAAVARGCWRRLRVHGDETDIPRAADLHDAHVKRLTEMVQSQHLDAQTGTAAATVEDMLGRLGQSQRL